MKQPSILKEMIDVLVSWMVGNISQNICVSKHMFTLTLLEFYLSVIPQFSKAGEKRKSIISEGFQNFLQFFIRFLSIYITVFFFLYFIFPPSPSKSLELFGVKVSSFLVLNDIDHNHLKEIAHTHRHAHVFFVVQFCSAISNSLETTIPACWSLRSRVEGEQSLSN